MRVSVAAPAQAGSHQRRPDASSPLIAPDHHPELGQAGLKGDEECADDGAVPFGDEAVSVVGRERPFEDLTKFCSIEQALPTDPATFVSYLLEQLQPGLEVLGSRSADHQIVHPASLARRVLVLRRALSTRGGHIHQDVGHVILPRDRDPRFITIRRGGTLTDSDHRLLALWAAAAVAHVAAHELGAAAYAITAACAAPRGEGDSAGRLECRLQREQLPDAIRELVLDEQRLRNEICWSVFDC